MHGIIPIRCFGIIFLYTSKQISLFKFRPIYRPLSYYIQVSRENIIWKWQLSVCTYLGLMLWTSLFDLKGHYYVWKEVIRALCAAISKNSAKSPKNIDNRHMESNKLDGFYSKVRSKWWSLTLIRFNVKDRPYLLYSKKFI